MSGAALEPRDETELAELLAAPGGALEILGAGTKRGIGRALEAQPLELAALRGILDYEPRELVLSARAATPLAEIDAALRSERQQLASEPPDLGALLGSTAQPTLGGALAANLSGPRRISSGSLRDHFLGFRAVNGRGERFKGGGRVVKNVTGYDLPKLLAGSWGTLAVLTEVTVRVHPAPECERTLRIEVREAGRACALLRRALGSDCELSAAAFEPGRGVLLRLEGWEDSLRAQLARLLHVLGQPDHELLDAAASRDCWRQIREVRSLADAPVLWRLCIPPRDAPRILEALAAERYLIDWGGGLVWLAEQDVRAESVRRAVHTGHALLVKAPAALRATTAVFPPRPGVRQQLDAALKAAFDPLGRLNPGRMS